MSTRGKPGNSWEQRGWQEPLILAAALKLGLFPALDQAPSSAAELAGRLGYDRRATVALLEALAELGHLARADGRYTVTPASRALLLDPESPDYHPFSILHTWNLMERWLTLPEVVRSGHQVERPYTHERRETFVRSMKDAAQDAVMDVVDRCQARLAAGASILDIGGGPGSYAREFARRGFRVTLLDRPEVIEIVAPELATIAEVGLVAGDFNRKLPGGPFDLALMGNIFHIYGPVENLSLLTRVARLLKPGGVAAIVDLVRGRSLRAALFAITMMVNTDTGNTWTENDYRDWLQTAGFTDVELSDLKGGSSQLILASLAGGS